MAAVEDSLEFQLSHGPEAPDGKAGLKEGEHDWADDQSIISTVHEVSRLMPHFIHKDTFRDAVSKAANTPEQSSEVVSALSPPYHWIIGLVNLFEGDIFQPDVHIKQETALDKSQHRKIKHGVSDSEMFDTALQICPIPTTKP